METGAAGDAITQLWLSLQVGLLPAPAPSSRRKGGRASGRTLPGSFTLRVHDAPFLSLPQYPSTFRVESDLPGHSGTRPFIALLFAGILIPAFLAPHNHDPKTWLPNWWDPVQGVQKVLEFQDNHGRA